MFHSASSYRVLAMVAAGGLPLAATAPVPAVAQIASPAEPMDMTQAVQAAVRAHPSIRGARAQERQAAEGVEAAKAGYRPQVTGGVESQINTYRNSSYDSRFVYTATLNASQMLYDFGKVAGAKRQAQAGVRASEAQVELAMDEIIVRTAQAWVDARTQQRLVQIAREQLDAVTYIRGLVRERVEKGATSRSDLEQANSRLDSLQSLLLAAEADAQRARLTLMHLTGQIAPVAIKGDIPAFLQNEACEVTADADTPAVRVAQAQLDDAQAQLDIAKAERLPTVSLDGSVGYALTDGSRLYGEYRTTGQFGVNFSMPLYQGGAAGARERGVEYQLRAYEDAVRQARLEERQGLADARAQAAGWASRAPVMETRVNSIDATRDLYRQQYLELGTRSLLDLLNAEQEYYSARVDQAQGLYAQYRLAVQCLYHSDRLRSAFGVDQASAEPAPDFVGPVE
ncbi:MAG: TolC family outer membrane protein [Tsuneonella suprasediminis]|nr:TolC family outer membrane protein [Altererythrobacter sp. N1]